LLLLLLLRLPLALCKGEAVEPLEMREEEEKEEEEKKKVVVLESV